MDDGLGLPQGKGTNGLLTQGDLQKPEECSRGLMSEYEWLSATKLSYTHRKVFDLALLGATKYWAKTDTFP